MKITNVIALVSVLLLSNLYAESEKIETITTLDNKTYKSVTVSKRTASSITIMHESGIAKILLKNLPEELQKKFNYDSKAAEEELNLEAEKKKKQRVKYLKKQREAMRLKKLLKLSNAEEFYVMQILDNGMLVNNVAYHTTSSGLASIGGGGGAYTTRRKGSNVFYVEGHPKTSTLVDGSYFSGMFIKSGTFSYTTSLGVKKTVSKYKYIAEKRKKHKK